MIDRETCLRFGATGPVLRGAGVARDVRKDMPYSSYEDFDFDLVTAPCDEGVEGDSWNRHRVRLLEILESIKIRLYGRLLRCLDEVSDHQRRAPSGA